MSGSPIIQDGKLVGAVTHVLVNDPTTGYGIFIENMLDAAAWSLPLHKGALERRKIMDFYKVPIGFGMALAVHEPAMNAYSAMTEDQKQEVINKAHNTKRL